MLLIPDFASGARAGRNRAEADPGRPSTRQEVPPWTRGRRGSPGVVLLRTKHVLDTPPVKSVEFTTHGWRPHEQYDAWRGWHNQTFDGSPTAPAKAGFVAKSNAVTMDGLALVRISMPATRVMRTRQLIRRNPVDHWAINMGLRSTTRLTIGDTTLEAPAKSPFVVSLADEMVSERRADERLQLYLARDSFPSLAPILDAARGTVITGPFGTMLAEFLELLDRNLGHVDAASAAPLKDAIGSMIAACVSPSRDRVAIAGGHLDLGRMERVRRVVRQKLRAPEIGPDALCRLAGMSRSALYRLMESQGGVTRYIRRQRLLESRKVLGDAGCDKSIAAIAEEFCFSDAADFSRAFRREFGLAPSDVRAGARSGHIPVATAKWRSGEGAVNFTDFIRAL